MGMKVKDLAQILNLSPSTVSLVLNNRPGISEATRNRVREAVIRLGCEDLMVQDTEEQKRILFVVYRKHGDVAASTPYFSQLFSEIIEGVEFQAKAKGFDLMISYMDRTNFRQEAERLCTVQADGIILLATEMENSQVKVLLDIPVPIVVLDNYMQERQYDCVTMNNEAGAFEAVSYLKGCGHRKIGYLHIVSNANNFMERYFGYLRAMECVGLEAEKSNILEIETEEGGDSVYGAVKRKLEECKDMPTAFFADNDIIAIYAIRVLRELGFRVPEDVSIVGFDNMMLSEMLDPPLTTIQIPKRTMGITAVNAIIDKMQGEHTGCLKTEVATSLIIRASVRNLL